MKASEKVKEEGGLSCCFSEIGNKNTCVRLGRGVCLGLEGSRFRDEFRYFRDHPRRKLGGDLRWGPCLRREVSDR